MRTILTLASALLITSVCVAGDPPVTQPRSPAATAAIAKAEKAIADAKAIMRETVARARKIEVEELKAAQQVAMKAGNLAEANAIDGVVKAVEAELQAKPQLPLVAGTNWKWKNTAGIVSFHADGSATCNTWGQGKGAWTPVDANSIRLVEPGRPTKITITFDAQRKASLWVYENGDIAYAARAPN